MPEYFCIGPSMAVDWGDQQPQLSRPPLRRVFGYFGRYGRRGGMALARIGASAALGLAPALVAKGRGPAALVEVSGSPNR
jgi:hypothetical protein